MQNEKARKGKSGVYSGKLYDSHKNVIGTYLYVMYNI